MCAFGGGECAPSKVSSPGGRALTLSPDTREVSRVSQAASEMVPRAWFSFLRALMLSLSAGIMYLSMHLLKIY